MKKIILSIFTAVALNASAQLPNFESAKSYASDTTVEISKIATDATGNIYIQGYFYGTVDLDPGIGVVSVTNPSETIPYFFLQKQAPNGSVLWTRQIVEYGVRDLTIDNLGNIITITSVYGPGTFDVDPGVGTTNVTFSASIDVLTIKYNTDGEILWANAIGLSTENEEARSVTTDSNNNIYFAAYATNGAYRYAMIIKRSPSGAMLWQKNLSGPGFCQVQSIITDESNNVIIGGWFRDYLIDFDPGPGLAEGYASASVWDNFVVKLNSSGDFLWFNELDGQSNNLMTYDLTTDSAGNVYQLGGIRGTTPIDFDPGVGVDEVTATTVSWHRLYIRKISANGTHTWVRLPQNGFFANFYSIDINANGQLIASGGTSFEIYDTDGNEVFSKAYSSAQAYSLCATNNGGMYLAGTFNGDFEIEENNSNALLTHSQNGSYDGFLIKYSQCFVDNSTSISGSTISATQSGVTYQWLDCNNGNTEIAGANAQAFTPTASGSYAVVIINGSCSDTSACQSVTVSTSGIEEQVANNFTLYPNPAKESLTLNNLTIDASLQIMDMIGQKVLETRVSAQEMTLDVSSIKPGAYFVQVVYNSAITSSKKLVIRE